MPVTIKQLSDCDIDYWALGHVHSPKVLSENPYIVYSGTIQGSNKNELGSKGCFLVSVKSVETWSLTTFIQFYGQMLI